MICPVNLICVPFRLPVILSLTSTEGDIHSRTRFRFCTRILGILFVYCVSNPIHEKSQLKEIGLLTVLILKKGERDFWRVTQHIGLKISSPCFELWLGGRGWWTTRRFRRKIFAYVLIFTYVLWFLRTFCGSTIWLLCDLSHYHGSQQIMDRTFCGSHWLRLKS